jgi:hypothetical protein
VPAPDLNLAPAEDMPEMAIALIRAIIAAADKDRDGMTVLSFMDTSGGRALGMNALCRRDPLRQTAPRSPPGAHRRVGHP